MRKYLSTLVLATLLAVALFGGTLVAAGVTRISFGAALPTNCANGNIYVKTAATTGLYWCSTAGSPGTWSAVGGGGSGTVTNTGTLTSGKAIVGNGTTDVTVSSLTAQFVGSSSGTQAAASMTTARLLGRTTASSGAVEEITVGSGLSLTAGSLSASGSSGGLVLLEQYTASASATLDFTTCISSTYDTYRIEGVDIIPATNAVSFLLRVGTGGGPTYDTGANYDWTRSYGNAGGAWTGAGSAGSTGQTSFTLFILASSTNTLEFSLTLKSPQNASYRKYFMWEGWQTASDAGIYHNGPAGGVYNPTTALTALRFLMSSGNIASGTIRCYGIVKT